MSKINAQQFKEQFKPLAASISAKQSELNELTNQFETLVNNISLGENPDADEQEEIVDTISDMAYDLGLEWDGSYNEGNMSFWTPSTC